MIDNLMLKSTQTSDLDSLGLLSSQLQQMGM